MMDFERALAVLAERREERIELGLDRVFAHLASLGNPQEKVPAILVAGTNGKGSFCSMLSSVLSAAGFRTGLYTSPHLISPCERIRVDGRRISEEDFSRLLERAASVPGSERLTYFELFTSVAFQYFAEKKAQAAVLEAGLGGRLDAVNAVEKPALSVLTSVDYDHMDFLGETLSEIAREKAGIFRPGVPALCAPLSPEPLKKVRETSQEKGVPLTCLEESDFSRQAETDWPRGRQKISGPDGDLWINLLGEHQVLNSALARRAAEILGDLGWKISPQDVRRGLESVSWPGRFQVVRKGEEGGLFFILDGAHNPQAMEAFCRTLESSPWAGVPKTFLLGFLKDKPYSRMLKRLSPHLDRVWVTAPKSPRALDPASLKEAVLQAAPKVRVQTCESAANFFHEFADLQSPIPSPLFICGSFYLVGEVLSVLRCLGVSSGGQPCSSALT